MDGASATSRAVAGHRAPRPRRALTDQMWPPTRRPTNEMANSRSRHPSALPASLEDAIEPTPHGSAGDRRCRPSITACARGRRPAGSARRAARAGSWRRRTTCPQYPGRACGQSPPALPFAAWPLGRLAAWPLGRLAAWPLGRLAVGIVGCLLTVPDLASWQVDVPQGRNQRFKVARDTARQSTGQLRRQSAGQLARQFRRNAQGRRPCAAGARTGAVGCFLVGRVVVVGGHQDDDGHCGDRREGDQEDEERAAPSPGRWRGRLPVAVGRRWSEPAARWRCVTRRAGRSRRYRRCGHTVQSRGRSGRRRPPHGS